MKNVLEILFNFTEKNKGYGLVTLIGQCLLSFCLYETVLYNPVYSIIVTLFALAVLFYARVFIIEKGTLNGYLKNLSYVVFFFVFGRNYLAFHYNIGTEAPLYLCWLNLLAAAYILSTWIYKAVQLWKELKPTK